LTIDRFEISKPEVLVFTSSKAGSGRGREQIPALIESLQKLGLEGSLVHEVDALKQQVAARRFPVVVAAGGDGTICLAAAVVGHEVPIVPMPLGTENLLARYFGHQAHVNSVIETIRHGSSFHLDRGMANGKPFLIMATCGFDAEVVRAMHLTRQGHIRRLSYLKPILRALRVYRFPELCVTIDSEEKLECHWAMVFNLPRYGGGLNIEPNAVGDDGQLDVILLEKGSILSGFKYLFGIWLGRHLGFSDVIRRRCRSVSIESDSRVPCELDGDYAGCLPLKIEIEPKRVQIYVPPKSSISQNA
jgi:diacylglycerol kinase family enzyme